MYGVSTWYVPAMYGVSTYYLCNLMPEKAGVFAFFAKKRLFLPMVKWAGNPLITQVYYKQ